MKGLKTTLYKRSEQLPALDESNFFHSRELFDIARETTRQQCTDYITNIRDEGATVTELTDEEHQAWVDATAAVKDQYMDTIGADLVKAVEDVCAQY